MSFHLGSCHITQKTLQNCKQEITHMLFNSGAVARGGLSVFLEEPIHRFSRHAPSVLGTVYTFFHIGWIRKMTPKVARFSK